jgi:hypothetical protein
MCVGAPSWAQPHRAGGADVEALRISFITRKLSLTPDEAKQFWPVFNAFEADLKKVRAEKKELSESVNDFSSLTDAQVKEHLDKLLDLDQKELDLKKTYTANLMEVIPAYKVALLYQAVEDFRRWLIERAQPRRPGGNQ